MPLYENAFCPVCNREFQEGDDIVYCPECGTPHHRDCYNAVGHCVNKGLHSSGYSYYDDSKSSKSNDNKPEEKESAPSLFQSAKNDKDENEANYSPFGFFNPIPVDSAFENDEEKIGGESVADYAVTIRTNTSRFIKLFKEFESKERKISWNWGAFFFGSLYLFFRKMYKQAISFFCAFIAVMYGSSFAIIKLAPNFAEGYMNFVNLYAQNKATPNDMQALFSISDYSTAYTISCISVAAIVLLRIIQALFADRFYKKVVSDFIKNVNEQIKNGASFVQGSFMNAQSSEMTQKQMKKYYLARRGGTTLFLPLMVASVAFFILSYF